MYQNFAFSQMLRSMLCWMCNAKGLFGITTVSKDTRTVKPDFYAVPPQNIFEISPGFQLAMLVNHCNIWFYSKTSSLTLSFMTLFRSIFRKSLSNFKNILWRYWVTARFYRPSIFSSPRFGHPLCQIFTLKFIKLEWCNGIVSPLYGHAFCQILTFKFPKVEWYSCRTLRTCFLSNIDFQVS